MTIIICFIEPISGTAPKIPLTQKFIRYIIDVGLSVAILCPAQAYPVPNFRLVFCIYFFKQHWVL